MQSLKHHSFNSIRGISAEKCSETPKIRCYPVEHLMIGSANMRASKLVTVASAIFLAAFLPGIGWAQHQNSRSAQPGTINYVKGQASADNQPLNPNPAVSTH